MEMILLLCISTFFYGVMGTITGLGHYKVTRSNPSSKDNDPIFTAGVVGTFWPIGMWFAISNYLTAPKVVKIVSKAQEERERRILREREDIRLDEMEQQNRMARFQLDRQIAKEIESGGTWNEKAF